MISLKQAVKEYAKLEKKPDAWRYFCMWDHEEVVKEIRKYMYGQTGTITEDHSEAN